MNAVVEIVEIVNSEQKFIQSEICIHRGEHPGHGIMGYTEAEAFTPPRSSDSHPHLTDSLQFPKL